MPLFLPVRLSSSTVAIACCDRCRKKVYLDDLRPDGNSPQMRVCPDCYDGIDPYKLPSRRPENISLQNPRPPDPLDTSDPLD